MQLYIIATFVGYMALVLAADAFGPDIRTRRGNGSNISHPVIPITNGTLLPAIYHGNELNISHPAIPINNGTLLPGYHRNVSTGAAWVVPASRFDLGARAMTCECFDPDGNDLFYRPESPWLLSKGPDLQQPSHASLPQQLLPQLHEQYFPTQGMLSSKHPILPSSRIPRFRLLRHTNQLDTEVSVQHSKQDFPFPPISGHDNRACEPSRVVDSNHLRVQLSNDDFGGSLLLCGLFIHNVLYHIVPSLQNVVFDLSQIRSTLCFDPDLQSPAPCAPSSSDTQSSSSSSAPLFYPAATTLHSSAPPRTVPLLSLYYIFSSLALLYPFIHVDSFTKVSVLFLGIMAGALRLFGTPQRHEHDHEGEGGNEEDHPPKKAQKGDGKSSLKRICEVVVYHAVVLPAIVGRETVRRIVKDWTS
ncbi:MAG: hypothetical protein Q9173_006653 [Seirophora scorigena]